MPKVKFTAGLPSAVRPRKRDRILRILNQPIVLVLIGSCIIAAAIATRRSPRYIWNTDGLMILDTQTGAVSTFNNAPRIFEEHR